MMRATWRWWTEPYTTTRWEITLVWLIALILLDLLKGSCR